MKLGKLKRINLREAWKHEAFDFTNWLAETENLGLLGEEIGIDIELIKTEEVVGKFKLDILAKDPISGNKIVIENQLEQSDHDHLGKIITYAAGVDASHVIWIVRDIRDEHLQAIDWLNDHTDDEISFFLVRMELWQIGDSPYAPKFHILSQPNDWAKAVKQSANDNELTETKLLQHEYWTSLRDYAETKNFKLRFRKPLPQHWTDMSIGSSNAHLSLTVNTTQNEIACELYIPNSKDLFSFLYKNKVQIESQLDTELEWMELPDRKASRIKLTKSGDLSARDSWGEQFDWFLQITESFQECFNSYMLEFNQL